MNDSVACVVAPLAAHNDVGLAGKDINNFSFAFVPPLGPNQNRVCHGMEKMGKKLSRCILPDALGTAKENRMTVGRCKKFRVSGSSRDHRADFLL
jgi:hypothetical protein